MNNKDSIARNNYFLGKLLTAQDFELEQSYFNKKRQKINNYYLGRGVVYGLTVSIDDKFTGRLKISPGLAIDSYGREIIVSLPENPDLKNILNFKDVQSGGNSQRVAYLCIKYKEEFDEYTISPFTVFKNKPVYEKITESYDIYLDYGNEFLSDSKLEEVLKGEHYFWNKAMIYNDKNVIINIKTPKYIQPSDGLLKCELEIEKLEILQDKISVSYSICILNDDKSKKFELLTCDFNEDENSLEMFYNISQLCTIPINIIDKKQSLLLSIEVKKIKLGENSLNNIINPAELKVNLIYNVQTKIRNDYFLNYVEKDSEQDIYLAKIFYELVEQNYKINKIVNLPFNQYIEKSSLADILQKTNISEAQLIDFLEKQTDTKIDTVNQKIDAEIDTVNQKIDAEIDTINKQINTVNEQINSQIEVMKSLFDCMQKQLTECLTFNWGELSIDDSLSNMDIHKHGPIKHRLGSGYVQIYCEIIGIDDNNKNLFRGSGNIFNPEIEIPEFDIGTKLDKTNGEFYIYVKNKSGVNPTITANQNIKLVWYAYKNPFIEKTANDFLFIKPNLIFIKCGASFEFTIFSSDNNVTAEISPEGDTPIIDANSLKLNYTASSKEGLYEIKVSSGKMKDSAFVYVTK